jgi:protein arginine N-methyltransferase 1
MASFAEDESPIMKGDAAAKASDYANYFCSYAELYHQKQMLMDHNRMRAYHDSIMLNKSLFEGKTILDVGTGSGVLAIWAAQAGAAKVYAVEFTDMALHAKALVEKNNLTEIVEVIQTSAEDLDLGDVRVDIIISEWMGYFLLRESMVDSVLRARNRWLKPGGTLFPSHATMLWGAITYEEDRVEKQDEYTSSMRDWDIFVKEMADTYKVDMSVLDKHYEREQREYYIYSSLWTELGMQHVVGQPAVVRRLDLNTCTIADAANVPKVDWSVQVDFNTRVSGFAGWFTVDFAGSEGTPVKQRVVLSTGPEGGRTHWGQQVFYLPEPIDCVPNTRLHGDLVMDRQDKNKRLYTVTASINVDDEPEPRFAEAKYEMP